MISKVISVYEYYDDFLVFYGMNIRKLVTEWCLIKHSFDGDLIDFVLDQWKGR